jgi:hypothetical protein
MFLLQFKKQKPRIDAGFTMQDDDSVAVKGKMWAPHGHPAVICIDRRHGS